MKKWIPYIVLLIVFVFLFAGNVDAQCSQCALLADQSGVSTVDDEIFEHKTGNFINTAILYIMVSPYILGALFLITFRKRIKKYLDSRKKRPVVEK